MYADLTIVGLFIFVYSAIAGGVERTPLTGPILFTAFGLALGPVGLGWLSLDVDREGLNVESGLNDGICVPMLLALLALATGAEQYRPGFSLRFFAEAIGIGLAVGTGLTLLGARLLRLCEARGWVTETWRQLPVVALAFSCFALAQTLGGSGFIAAFAGGLLLGALAKREKHGLLLAAEGTGDTLALFTWVLFGAGIVGQAVGHFSWRVVLYAVLSLTLVRMLPVYLSLGGLRLGARAKLFIGWFGPRGLASIVFGLLVLEANLPGTDILTTTVVCTIGLSILLHGLTANPLVAVFAQGARRQEQAL